MLEPSCDPKDLELFQALLRAADRSGTTPCLIGAGALQLGEDLGWDVRLARQTIDWDFAVRVDSWEQFERLAEHLCSRDGGFRPGQEPHRFHHATGRTLDVLPFGGLESPPGTLRWSDGQEMRTTGFQVLDEHHEHHRVGGVDLRTASLPALVGLKLLAYDARRPGVVRDIADVHLVLEASEAPEGRLAQTYDDFAASGVELAEAGAWWLGREVGRIFPARNVDTMRELLDEAGRPEAPIVTDVVRSRERERPDAALVRRRLAAFRAGLGPASAGGRVPAS